MIKINTHEFRTLDQEFSVNGKRVISAYANGRLVYPEREDTMVMKLIGSVDRVVEHDHAHDDPSGKLMGGHKVYYDPGARYYREKASFSLVLRNHNYPQGDAIHQYYYNAALENEMVSELIPAVPCPPRGMVQYALPYLFSTNPFTPEGDGVHPLVGSESKNGYRLFYRSTQAHPVVSAELLVSIDVSAPPVCSWRAEQFYGESSYPYKDAVGIPLIDYVEDLPRDINGTYRFAARRGYFTKTYDNFRWSWDQKPDIRFEVNLARPSKTDKPKVVWSDYVAIKMDNHWTRGYEVPYLIKGIRNGTYTETVMKLKERFVIANIPYTQILYSGLESEAPDWALHPLEEDLAK